MISSFLLHLTIKALQRSGNPNLKEIAKALENLEDYAAEKIIELVTGNIREDGSISQETTEKVITTMSAAQQKGHSTSSRKAPSLIGNYLQVLNDVSNVGSRRRLLLLRGFIHTDKCTSLWIFDMSKPVFTDSGNVIYLINSIAEIYVFEQPFDEAKIRESNKQFGIQEAALEKGILPDFLEMTAAFKVTAIRPTSIELEKEEVTRVKMPSGREQDKRNKVEQKPTIDTENYSGISSLLDSLPQAIADRESSLKKLAEVIKSRPI